jgi:CubicO group peptidase (beta-lactamase class C family)
MAAELWPTHGWEESTPEAQGLSSGALADALDFIRNKHIEIHSLLIERNGSIVLDAYFFPYSDNELHDIASVTKSVTSTLIGAAIKDKQLFGVDELVLPMFPASAARNKDPRKAGIRIRDLLSMTSGLDCHYDHGEKTLTEMRQSQHWAQFMLDLPMADKPGKKFEYCSSGMHVLSAVITKATGMSALDYARAELFAPLGITGSEWPADPDGISYGWGDLHLQPRDMAKLGYLWLHGGTWDGQQIVPKEYLDAATQAHARAPWGDQYGYGLWVYPERELPVYEGNGRGGQRISIVPAKDLVVVMTGGGFEPGEIGDFIGKSIKSDTALAPDPKGNSRLAKAVADAAQPPAAAPASPLPQLASVFAGKVYLLDDNPLGLKSLALTFREASGASARIGFRDGRIELDAIGLDGVPRLSPTVSGRPVALAGKWEKDAFDLDYDQVADINAFSLRLSPEGEKLTVHVVQRADTGQLDITFHGHSSR